MPPVRQATRRYADLGSFLREYETTLSKGALLLPADQAGGELAPEIKLDFLLPLVGRVGPAPAQVVARLPDGSAALRLPELPPQVEEGFKKVYAAIEEVRQHLVSTGALVAREEVEALRAELEDLRSWAEEEGAYVEDEDTDEPGPPPVAPPQVEAAPVQAARVEEEAGEDEIVDDIIDETPAEDEDEIIDDEQTGPRAPAPVSAPTPPAAAAPAPAFRERGVPVLELSKRAPSASGALGDPSLRRLLVALSLGRNRGALRVETPDGRVRTGYWEAGGPVAWRADPPVEDEQLGKLLLRSGQVTEGQIQAASVIMQRQGRLQGEALVAIGALQASQLMQVLTRQSEFILMRVLQEKAGRWAFYALDELPEPFKTPPVPVAAALLKALVSQARRLPVAQLRGALKKSLELTVLLKPAAIVALREYRYTREEATLLDALRVGGRLVGELLESGPVSFDIAAPLVWALVELGLVEPVQRESAEERQRLLDQLEVRRARVDRGAPFELLELHWICLPEEVQRNAERIQRELSAEVLGTLDPPTERLVESLRTAVEMAARLLMDADRRRAIRRTFVAADDIERCAELLREAAVEARRSGDHGKAKVAEAKANELAGQSGGAWA